eukprot:Gregarina_sp_Poly_1__3597@NODE_2054_length_2754_cov_30_090808_g27_i2_p2_GENE_NODE_2054_length_2754_cov_30_090808_g27_i2NODE_2054_length_2754_cov_30_090808_g27_i2_p2_ORF_typecomplete_len142_score19_39_NODE_2054_length_2754_cov_30_090808_g27_i216032028
MELIESDKDQWPDDDDDDDPDFEDDDLKLSPEYKRRDWESVRDYYVRAAKQTIQRQKQRRFPSTLESDFKAIAKRGLIEVTQVAPPLKLSFSALLRGSVSPKLQCSMSFGLGAIEGQSFRLPSAYLLYGFLWRFGFNRVQR